jgi:hypothetical protein
MTLSLFGLFTSPRPRSYSASATLPQYRTMIEPLEDRTLMSASAVLAAPTAAPAVAVHANPGHDVDVAAKLARAAQILADKRGITSVLPLQVTGVTSSNGQLTLQGLLGKQAFSAPITFSLVPSAAAADGAVTPAATTPILALHLGPIHLNVLGLHVDTSEICLNVNAISGPGNLLGNLLTSIANLLNGGLTPGGILGGLTSAEQTLLTNGLTGLFGGALGAINSPAAITNATTNILHLSLGPVNLNLLGLQVLLNNCANPAGPVTIDVGAQSGPGNLLGNLLGGVAHLLDNPSNANALANALDRLINGLTALL